MGNSTVTGIISTLRGRFEYSQIENIINSFHSFDDILKYIYKLGGDQKISNSEGLLLAAIYGAHEMKNIVQILNLNKHFPLYAPGVIDSDILNDIMKSTTGLIISSPVYFGDRSSLIADMISFVKNSESDSLLPLDQKAVGVVSVGAKRNGGQETTNVYTLYDCLRLGACAVGNGPPISQYGGTGWGGNIGSIIDDNFGLNTSRGTGQRVGILSRILNLSEHSTPIRILFLVTRSDREGYFIEKIKSLSFSRDTEIDILDLQNFNIIRCKACSICPGGETDKDYTCIVSPKVSEKRYDDMKFIHSRLTGADCIILAHYSGVNAGPDRFNVFMERTRFIRRNNFELADRVFSVFYESDTLNDIYPVRFMSNFLRHNLFVIGPFYQSLKVSESGGYIENIPLHMFMSRIEAFARKANIARKNKINTFDQTYEPIGYV